MSSATLIERLTARLPEFQALRQDLHRHPETAFEERRTSQIVADALESYGIEVVKGIAQTGVIGILRAGSSGRAIGLRADMDALNLQEANVFAHRSVNVGKMHGCGHDGHTATLLAAAAQLAESRNFDGTVYFIFQPAEEGQGGAQKMIEEGLFERFPMEAVFGLHNYPGLAVGSFAVRTGPIMAGTDRFDIVIEGVGGHAAMPHLASDPVVASAALIQALQTIVTRNKNPMDAAVLSITRIEGGASFNVIPDRVELSGTVRYFSEDARSVIEGRMEQLVDMIAAAHGCKGDLEYSRLIPATVNWPEQTSFSLAVLKATFGEDRICADVQPLMAGEDFAFMLAEKPGCYVLSGNGDAEASAAVHNPNYDFNDGAIPLGAAYWVRLAEAGLSRSSEGQFRS